MIAATARGPWLLLAALPLALVRHPSPQPIPVADPPTVVTVAPNDDGLTLGIAADKASVAVGEEVHVAHAVGVPAGHDAWIMGPKPVYGEIVDGQTRTEMYEIAEYPWVGEYDGAVVPGPRVDNNFAVTSYSCATPGKHTIVWSIGGHVSNTLEIDVIDVH